MSRVKKIEKSRADELRERYLAIQLTPEEKAELRAEAEKRGAEAAAAGVYERLIGLIGKVHLGLDVDEVRKLREDRD